MRAVDVIGGVEIRCDKAFVLVVVVADVHLLAAAFPYEVGHFASEEDTTLLFILTVV